MHLLRLEIPLHTALCHNAIAFDEPKATNDVTEEVATREKRLAEAEM